MEFYVVGYESGRYGIVKRFMCDNIYCPNFTTREEGMPMEKAVTGFSVRSMTRYDACSPECQDAIRKMENTICE